jgi:hypothetical protein
MPDILLATADGEKQIADLRMTDGGFFGVTLRVNAGYIYSCIFE